jgi:SAM-dependent methyltransferase
MGTDKDWEKWGATDPYFGVLSTEKYRAGRFDPSARREFFASGEAHVERVIRTIRDQFDSRFTPSSALDFGCGVGRLVVPLAAIVDQVVGVDVSASMLSEARNNCDSAGAANVRLVRSGDLAGVQGQYDLVHSYIVLQHIPWRRGRKILQALSEMVAPGGYLAVHFYTACHAPALARALVRLRYVFPPANWARNVMRGRPVFEPAMQLHVYDLDTIKRDLEARRFGPALCVDEPTGSEFSSTFLFARRLPAGS